ncbi:hypothetical protein [Streptomyces zaomyceticus]|uniref:hypothetical protein n=1 Tax=Streptomyces zaomyceticus TaxID=68286 RepID=UPI00167437D0|nr:hypothetical protein [Streptomyces zaomyceticus]GHG00426.1 hypothetical protein GCM10018791_09660 [Streptomyces zaomyceticus]
MALNADRQPVDGADDGPLPCGRSLEAVWEGTVERGRSPAAEAAHRGSCPHCSAALADLRTLDALVTAARELDPPGGTDALTARVMDVVRLELRPGRTLPLGTRPDDTGWIFESAAARELRAAADGLPGIRAGSCRVRPLDVGAAEVGQGRGPLRVHVEVAASLEALPTAAEAVRGALFAVAERVLGMDVREIDVRVVDVLHEDMGTDGTGTGHGPEGSAG